MASNNETLNVFYSFPLLPNEIRKAIWESSIDEIQPKTMSIQPSHAAVHPLLQVCKESRELCLKVFTLCKSRQGDQVPQFCFYINFGKDTLYINHVLYPFLKGKCAFYNAVQKYPDWLSRVKFLALNILEAGLLAIKLWYEPGADIWTKLGSRCPRLETLSVVMNGPIRRKIDINFLPCARKDFSAGIMAMMGRLGWLTEESRPDGRVVVGHNQADENEVSEYDQTDDDEEELEHKKSKDHEGDEDHESDDDEDIELIPSGFEIELVDIDMTAVELPVTEEEREWLMAAEHATRRGWDAGEPYTVEEKKLLEIVKKNLGETT